MADYREISQEYAKEAIKAAMLINGGAAVALLTQATALLDKRLADEAAGAMIWWALGLGLATLTWVLAFGSTRYVDKYEDEEHAPHLETSNRLMFSGLVAILVSLACFGIGCVVLACGLLNYTPPT